MGDRLWVRETWRPCYCSACESYGVNAGHIEYRADGEDCEGWRSPIFMKRALSRLELEIKRVRAERIMSITEADAIAEGCPPQEWYRVKGGPEHWFRKGWDVLNGARGFGSNVDPWIWVLDVMRVR